MSPLIGEVGVHRGRHPGNRGAGGGKPVPVHPGHPPGNTHGPPKVKGAHVIIIAPHVRLRCRLGDGPALVTDGYGGWVEVQRPNDVSLTQWQGVAPFRFTIPILLDGYAENRSVQKHLNDILGLGRQDGGATQPPAFKVFGPIPFSGREVVMESTPTFGDVIRNFKGELVRQVLTLNLMEHVPPDRITFKKLKHPKGDGGTKGDGDKGHNSRGGHHRTHGSETVNKVSAVEYGDTSMASAIGALNGIRDPRKPLPDGTLLRLPA